MNKRQDRSQLRHNWYEHTPTAINCDDVKEVQSMAVFYFNQGLKFAVSQNHILPEFQKDAAKDHARAILHNVLNSLYDVATFDKFVCHKTIAFYWEVLKIIKKF